MNAQLALLATQPASKPRSRSLDALLAFDTEDAAEAFLGRHGAIWATTLSGKVTMTLRPRQVSGEWLLCSFWSGYPWCLDRRRTLRRMRVADVMP